MTKEFESFCAALDESNDTSNNAQLAFIVQDTTKSYKSA
jgi:hypothetical protein